VNPGGAFDVVIVGGGAAGCVVARRLAERGDRSVLLLEAGPDLGADPPLALRDGWGLPSGPTWPYDWGFKSEPDPTGSAEALRRGRLLGGTSWLTRFAVRGAAADFDAWAARGNPGWGFEDVLPTFRAIEADAEFGDLPWHGARGPIPITRYPAHERSDIHDTALDALASVGFETVADHNEPAAIGAGPMPMSSRDGDRVTTLDAYLPRTLDMPGLTIQSESPVASVVVDAGHAHAVRLLDGTEIEGARVVLSAGVYGSPPILLRSGIGPADQLQALGIGVRVDLPGVGENLSDHPGVDLDSGWRGMAKTGPALHSIATFRSSMAPPGGAPDLMFWLTDPEGEDPRFSLDPILLKPRSRGTVRLRSANPTDPPRIALPGLRDPADIDRLAEGYDRSLELVNRPEIRRLAPEAPASNPGSLAGLRQRVVENAYSIPHVVGTCRMGPSPEAGDVVDALGRVHGVEGLSVIDASIIPDAPSGFPHLITIMLAEHLAARAFEDLPVSP
jgi:choline dehydrogenase